MFGFGKQARANEAIRRGVRAALTGAYFHPTDISRFCLNENASAFLYTEALAHQIYALGYISSFALAKEKWATHDFFFDAAIDGMKESERSTGSSTEQLAPTLLKRFVDFQALTADQRASGAHYMSSANLVLENDPSTNPELIVSALQAAVDKYSNDARKMFGL